LRPLDLSLLSEKTRGLPYLLPLGASPEMVSGLSSSPRKRVKGVKKLGLEQRVSHTARALHPCTAHGVSLAWKVNSWVRVTRRAARSPTSRGYSVWERHAERRKPHLAQGVPFPPEAPPTHDAQGVWERVTNGGRTGPKPLWTKPPLLGKPGANGSRLLAHGASRRVPEGPLSSSYPPVT